MKKILLITTGGTIAMQVDKKRGGAVPSLQADDFVRYLPPVKNLADVDIHMFSNIPSPYMNVPLWCQLTDFIDEKLSDGYDGIVVTHGTDTLEETAFFVELTVKSEKPIVFTAAMRNLDELSGDGPRNIWGALKTVVSKNYSSDIGVTLVLNDEIHAVRDVTKTYTSNVATFRSPLFGPLGLVDNDQVTFYYKPYKRIKIRSPKVEEKVALIKAYAGMSSDLIDAAVTMGYKGLVIEAFGRGNLPDWIVPSLERAIQSGVTVVISSRCYMGRVFGDYAYDGGGRHLGEIGSVFAYDLRGIKARILLMLALGKYGEDREAVRRLFDTL
ncbi:MAG TPA: asparaginase [Candidatus Mcinerneyibacteriales bacterium]|nr:asparaginase [Candidatus Mcinerneyibacteriales bacterium]HPJ70570.1 asparaginase [Candidatus Mcinerneyibacteriales bacterium]